MATDDDFDRPSLPCFAHELALTDGGYVTFDPVAARDVGRWRTAERRRLTEARLAMPVEEAARLSGGIARALGSLVALRPGLVLGVYELRSGTPDIAPWIAEAKERGVRIALPSTDGPHDRPVFREEDNDGPVEVLLPDVIVVPLVGYDRSCHILGDGSGFYDRFLATADPRPTTIAVGRPDAEVETVFPQPHDVPMDFVVTGRDRVMRRSRGDG